MTHAHNFLLAGAWWGCRTEQMTNIFNVGGATVRVQVLPKSSYSPSSQLTDRLSTARVRLFSNSGLFLEFLFLHRIPRFLTK